MIRSLEVVAFFFFLDSLKLKGRRHSECCEELCDGEEKGRRGGKTLQVLPGGGRTGCEKVGQFCWDQHYEEEFVQSISERCF